MPTITRDRRMLSRPLAIRSTILAPLSCWAVATRMCAFVAMVFGHDPPPCPSNTTPRDRAQGFWGSPQHTPYARTHGRRKVSSCATFASLLSSLFRRLRDGEGFNRHYNSLIVSLIVGSYDLQQFGPVPLGVWVVYKRSECYECASSGFSLYHPMKYQ